MLLLSFLVASLVTIASANAQHNLNNPDVLVDAGIEGVDFLHATMRPELDTTFVQMGAVVGEISELPKVLSYSFDLAIKESQDFYKDGDFTRAARVLNEAVELEPTNSFVLEPHARALYQAKNAKGQSFRVYKRLVSLLDSLNKSNPEFVAIDMWFREAYWKLGTLYMDQGEWNKAQFEINRFLMSIQELKGSVIYNQGLKYLTECYFEMSNVELYTHFANRTLLYDPENKYAKKIFNLD